MDNLSQDVLRELESKCIQDEDPWCSAMCPIHIDARQLCKLVSQGKFTEGRKLFEKKLIFPNIMSRICEEKCKSKCKRKELGNSINMRNIELACMTYGKEVKARVLLKPKKKEKILILGTSLSALSAAYELKSKGYFVDIFEKDSFLGKNICKTYEGILSDEIIQKDLKKVIDLDAKVYTNKVIEDKDLQDYKDKYDGIIVDGNIYESKLDYDEMTLQQEDKIFYLPKSSIAIDNIESGKRVSTSLERYFQKSSMTNAREHDGSHDTKLYTNLDGIESEEEILPVNGSSYSEEEAIKEASRCIDCNCLECMKGCEFLRFYKSHPKKLAREAYNNLAIALGNRTSNKMINSCSLCGQCKSLCPNGFDLSEVFEWARKHMVETDKMPASAFEFAMDDLEFSNSNELFTVIGDENSKYVFFPGCQLGASEPELVKVIYSDLKERLDDKVGIMLGCCGVIGKWSGHVKEFDEAISLIRKSLEYMKNPHVITACPTCYSIFNSSLENVKVSMIYDFINKDKLSNKGNGETIAIDDPCTARYDEKLQNQVREMGKLLGYNIEELDYNKEGSTCCGYGGLTCFSNKELKEDITKSRIKESNLSYLTYCINCRDSYLSQNKESKHILQLIYDFKGKNKKPNFSERRYNRAQLKLDLTQDKETKNNYDINLIMEDELIEKLEDRMILYKDIEDTIKHAEENQAKFLNKSNKHYIAYHQIKNVTFWVEYTIQEDTYVVYNAYSHRMVIEVD